MKVTIDIDCTPEEARAFLGLPDVRPMQDALLREAQARMTAGLQSMDPDQLVRSWLSGMGAGMPGMERLQTAFWSQMMTALGQTTTEGDKP